MGTESKEKPQTFGTAGGARCGAGGGTRTLMAFRPTDFRTTSAFAAAIRRLWSGLSLHRFPRLRELGAARLVSTPSPFFGAWLGIAFAGFPEFGQFCTLRFRRGTQFT